MKIVTLALAAVALAATTAAAQPDDGWQPADGRRLLHGFRLGYARDLAIGETMPGSGGMLVGYEAFYRLAQRSHVNVLVVGSATFEGLEQFRFRPAASGLVALEVVQRFQLGAGVHLTPEPQAPAQLIAAIAWTPRAGGMSTPVQLHVIHDPDAGHRAGITVGVTW